jgi:hypothetical protein
MKMKLAIGSIVAGYLALAALQDGAIQFWLVALAPAVVLGVAFALLVADAPDESNAGSPPR